MQTNYIQLAAIFGKKPGEPFYLKDKRTGEYIKHYRSTDNTPMEFNFQEHGLYTDEGQRYHAILSNLLDGQYEIVDAVNNSLTAKQLSKDIKDMCVTLDNYIEKTDKLSQKLNNSNNTWASMSKMLDQAKYGLLEIYWLINPEETGNDIN